MSEQEALEVVVIENKPYCPKCNAVVVFFTAPNMSGMANYCFYCGSKLKMTIQDTSAGRIKLPKIKLGKGEKE